MKQFATAALVYLLLLAGAAVLGVIVFDATHGPIRTTVAIPDLFPRSVGGVQAPAPYVTPNYKEQA